MWKSEEKLNKLYYVTFHASSQQYRSTKDTKRVQSAASDYESLTEVFDNSDLANKILGYLDEKDIFTTASVSKKLKEIIDADARDINQGCSKRITETGGNKFNSRYTEYRQHINLSGCISNDSQFDTVVKWISESKNLKSLNLSNNRIRPIHAKALAEALGPGKAVLTTLDLSVNSIGPTGAAAIAEALKSGMAVLTSLDLSSNDLTNWGRDMSGILAIAEALKSGMAVLTEINLFGNGMKEEGGTAIAAALKSNRCLKTLKSNFLGPGGAQVMAEALQVNSTLTDLQMPSNGIDAAGGVAIAKALEFNAVLTSLDLSSNNLTNRGRDMSGILAIAEALKSGMAVLKSLNLSANALCGIDNYGYGTYDPSGIQALAAALGSGSAVLTDLNIGWNNIGNDGTKALAEALGSGKAVLTDLNLSENRIGAEGAKALAEALESGKAVLTNLDLSRNQLCGLDRFGSDTDTYDTSGINAIADALKSGMTVLSNLNLRLNNISDETVTMLQKVANEKGVELVL
jgi:Ran GTPase-activating protein (RanGAP) involved in mRNA processing and transport